MNDVIDRQGETLQRDIQGLPVLLHNTSSQGVAWSTRKSYVVLTGD